MILLFGEKAHKSNGNSKVKNHPVENSGILAMNKTNNTNILHSDEHDVYSFSTQAVIDFTQYGENSTVNVAFMNGFSEAYSTLSADGGFSSFSGGECSCSCSCGSFSSMC